jgi:DNA-directed RNA polymerase specialized sigma24 family protein
MIDDLVELLESEREWLAQQPNMQPWDAGCQRIVERIIDCLRRYSAEVRDQVMNRESVDEREYVERLWRCLSHHWRDAIRRAERQPDVEKPSLDEVTRQIASGQGYRGKGDLGGDPLRDVVLAVAMVRKDQQATQTFQDEYYPLTFEIAAKIDLRMVQKRKLDPANPEPWWNDLVDYLAGYTRPKAALNKFDGHCALRRWLRQVAYRFLVRDTPDKVYNPEDDVGKPPIHEESLHLFSRIVDEAVMQLPDEDRLLLWLYICGLTTGQLAEIFSIHDGNATRRRQKVEKKLLMSIEERGSQRLRPEGFEGVLEDLRAEKKLFSRILRDALDNPFSQILDEAISSLADAERLLLSLYYLDDLPNNQVAGFFALPEETVIGQRQRAEERLLTRIKDYENRSGENQKRCVKGLASLLVMLRADKTVFGRILRNSLEKERLGLHGSSDESQPFQNLQDFHPEYHTSQLRVPNVQHGDRINE